MIIRFTGSDNGNSTEVAAHIFLSGSERKAQAGQKMNKTQLDVPRISNENLNISLYTDI